ncbi:retrovirus-related pol polyprotein from transposon TNT 1-94 [Tanacetum coccineum]
MSNRKMTRVPNKKSSSFGYQKSPTVGSSSFGSSSFRKDKGVENASNITMIKDVDPMLDNITVQGRCISLWHSHRLNEAHNPYSLDMVLQDSQMFRFEPLFKEGKCYAISNFAIAKNSGKLPLLPHKYKISFYKGTVVTRIDPFDENLNGFILEPFNRLLDGTHHYHKHEAVDVIGSVVAIGDVVPVQSTAGRKIRRTVVIEDSERFLENKQEDGEWMWHSIEKGPYHRPIITDPDNSIIPNDIYNSVDACKDAQKMWEQIRRLMYGSKEGESLESVYERLSTLVNVMDRNDVRPTKVFINTKFFNSLQPEWSKYVTLTRQNQNLSDVEYDALYDALLQFKPHVQASKAKRAAKNHDPLALIAHSNAYLSQSHARSYKGDAQEDKLTTAMMLLARAITQKFSTPTNNHLCTSSNTRNQAVIQDGRVDIQTKNAGYGGNGHYACDCPKPKVCDEKYFREQMLLAMKDEAGGTLNDEENDFMLDNSYGDETLKELTAACRGDGVDVVVRVAVKMMMTTVLWWWRVDDDELVGGDDVDDVKMVMVVSMGLRRTEKNEILKLKKEKISSDSKDIQANFLKKIKILENDFKRSQAQSIDFKLKLQHQKEKMACDNSWKSKLTKLSDENDKIKTIENEKNVNTKFDKYETLGKLLCVTPLNTNTAVKAKKVSNTKVKADRSKPVTSHSTPKNEQSQKQSANVIQLILCIVDSGCSKHMTGNLQLLINFVEKFMGTVRFSNDHFATITGYGDYVQGNLMICHVYYVDGLGHNLFSVGQFIDRDLEVAFHSNTCYVRNLEGEDLLTGSRDSNLYTISISELVASFPICLMSKATLTKSWLWHQRLSHLNFGTINHLMKKDLVDGILKFKYDKDHLCSACEQGKIKKASFPPKLVPSTEYKLELLHMDLCGPMRVANINGKRYILIQQSLQAQVLKVRSDNGTKFKNEKLWTFYAKLGITHNTSTVRTPQQNGAVERRNRTLVEAACTMLIFSKTPEFLWGEAIATAFFTQNHSLVHTRQ